MLFDSHRVATETLMSGASQDKASLTVETSAHVHVSSPCEFTLTLKDTRLKHSTADGNMKTADNEAEFRRQLESVELRFAYQNGVVDHLCPESSESAWALNFKKGILSSFQNSMDDFTQAQNLTEVSARQRW